MRGVSTWKDQEETANIISAYCPDEGVSLGQVLVPEGTKEIGSAPQLLKLLNVQGAVVTANAPYTQKTLASWIVDAKGNYCLAVTRNQRGIY